MSNNEILARNEDFLIEVFNVGMGNMAEALEQLLSARVNVKLPIIRLLLPTEVVSAIGSATMPVASVNMQILGDVKGELFYIVPNDKKGELVMLAEGTIPGFIQNRDVSDSSILEEIANVSAGALLTAIHKFTKLDLIQTIPVLSVDTLQSVLAEPLASSIKDGTRVLLIVNEFSIGRGEQAENVIRAYLLVVLSAELERKLTDLVNAAQGGFE